MELTIKCNVDNVGYDHKPTDEDMLIIKPRLAAYRRIVTGSALQSFICHGYSFNAGLLNGTNSASWQSQRLLVADVDDTSEETITEAVERMNDHGIAPFIAYQTFNSRPEAMRYRMIVYLDQEITDPAIMKDLIVRYQHFFRGSDLKCRDLARVFFGTRPDGVLIPCTNIITSVEAIRALPAPEPARVEPMTTGGGKWDHVAHGASQGRSRRQEDVDMDMLRHISPDCDRLTWMKIGTALKNAGYPFGVFDIWSAGSREGKYKGMVRTLRDWESFRGNATMASVAYECLKGRYGK